MRIACIIMAHKGPQQIERFLKKFSGLPFDFYIHIDKKIPTGPHSNIWLRLPRFILLQNRIRVRWASYSYIVASPNSLKQIFSTQIPYDFISIMSGQDYPIKPVKDFYHLLEKNPGENFISYDEDEEWWTHAITRINQISFYQFRFSWKIQDYNFS